MPARSIRWPPACCIVCSAARRNRPRRCKRSRKNISPDWNWERRRRASIWNTQSTGLTPTNISRGELEEALRGWRANSAAASRLFGQVIDGKRAYEYARRATEVQMRRALVRIRDADRVVRTAAGAIRIRCSKGTYIRSIARDLGERLGSGAYLTSLRRTRSGACSLEDTYSLAEIERILGIARASEMMTYRPVDSRSFAFRLFRCEKRREKTAK